MFFLNVKPVQTWKSIKLIVPSLCRKLSMKKCVANFLVCIPEAMHKQVLQNGGGIEGG